MSKHMDKAAEMVTSLTIDLSKALDNLEAEKQFNAFLKRSNARHIFDNEQLHATIRNLYKRIERLEREVVNQKKASRN